VILGEVKLALLLEARSILLPSSRSFCAAQQDATAHRLPQSHECSGAQQDAKAECSGAQQGAKAQCSGAHA